MDSEPDSDTSVDVEPLVTPAESRCCKRCRCCAGGCVACAICISAFVAALVGVILWLVLPHAGPSDFPAEPDEGAIGWTTKERGTYYGAGHFCQVHEPASDWNLKRCDVQGVGSTSVKVLTYNLFWWNLYGKRHGNGGSAGKLIADAGSQVPFDILAFQECDDAARVLADAGLAGTFAALPSRHAVAVAYRTAGWELIKSGAVDVAEDSPEQWYGKRTAVWVRLKHKLTGARVFFVNHHGPLPVNRPGGKCGPDATALNLLKVIGYFAHPGDSIVLVGDFNAKRSSETIKKLSEYMTHVYTGQAFEGVDNMFAACYYSAETANLGTGGSDHDALEAVLRIT